MCFSTESKLPPPRYAVAWETFSMIRKMILSRKIPQKPFSFRWKYGRISGNLQKAMGYYGSERKNKRPAGASPPAGAGRQQGKSANTRIDRTAVGHPLQPDLAVRHALHVHAGDHRRADRPNSLDHHGGSGAVLLFRGHFIGQARAQGHHHDGRFLRVVAGLSGVGCLQ